MNTYTLNQLHTFTKEVFIKCGMPLDDAIQAADVLLSADMRGIDSHGVARLSGWLLMPWILPLKKPSK